MKSESEYAKMFWQGLQGGKTLQPGLVATSQSPVGTEIHTHTLTTAPVSLLPTPRLSYSVAVGKTEGREMR